MMYNSNYWIEATALEEMNNHEIVVLEKDKNNEFTIRHATHPKDWLHNRAAYINEPKFADKYGKALPINIQPSEKCRCLIVDVHFI